MATRSKAKQSETPEAPELPVWAQRLRDRYVAGASSLFVLHGNVHDLIAYDGKYVPLRTFLSRMLGRTKGIVAFYDVANGLTFAKRKMDADFRTAVDARRQFLGGVPLPPALPRDAYRLFPWVETFLRDPSQHGAFVIEYAETVVPDGDVSFKGDADRAMRVTLQRWAADPAVSSTDNIIVLVTENLADIDRTVRSAPRLTPIEIPIPDFETRLEYIHSSFDADGRVGMSAKRIADATAGLTNFQIENLFREVRTQGGKLAMDRIRAVKRRIIEQECFGLVEFMDSEHDFSVVGGHESLKEALMRVVKAIKRGDKQRVPMGILLVGAMGTGKTFLMEAFANEVGLTALKFKNFRDKWVGSTEGNLEKILTVVKAMGNVLVVIDEGDRSIGGGSGGGDGGVDSRVTARLKEFMSDTAHRGSILFAMMTNRPDKLDADMKRPGRFDLKLPFFPPQDDETRIAVLKALIKKNKLKTRLSDLDTIAETFVGMTGAEIEAVLLLAIGFAEDRGSSTIVDEDILAAGEDFIPSRDDAMMRYMELLAVFECSSRRMLPERYRAMSSADLNAEVREQQRRLLKA
jgi:SpoVK/Ycf46/Vps4 family AAA+-type ATPase